MRHNVIFLTMIPCQDSLTPTICKLHNSTHLTAPDLCLAHEVPKYKYLWEVKNVSRSNIISRCMNKTCMCLL